MHIFTPTCISFILKAAFEHNQLSPLATVYRCVGLAYNPGCVKIVSLVSGVWLPFPCKRTACTEWPADKVQSSNRSNLPGFVHTAAPAGPSRPLPWLWLCLYPAAGWNILFSFKRETLREMALYAHWLKHWTHFSVYVGVLKGNSEYRVRPGYRKFLHFIVSSPRRATHCEAGLKRLQAEPTPPIWNRCQSGQEDLLLFGHF